MYLYLLVFVFVFVFEFVFEFVFVFVLGPYTDERRDVLENTPPEAQEISQRRGFCTPRPERLPEGEARGQSRGPRGAKSMLRQISRSEGGVISNGSQLSSV